MRTKKSYPIYAEFVKGTFGNDDSYYVSESNGTCRRFGNAEDAGAYYGSDLLSDLLAAAEAADEIRKETRAYRRSHRDAFDILAGAAVSIFGAAVLTVALYFSPLF